MVKNLTIELNEQTYRNAVLYFIKYCNNEYLHATKLNKLLYYLDFIHFRDHGKSVTGDTYIHKGYGPVPSHVDEVLAKLKGEGTIDTETVPHNDAEMINFELKDESRFDESVFSPEQKELLKKICDEFGNWPTDKIVAQTHLEAPWFYSKPYEIVDYGYAHDIDFFQE
ncbi:MAG: Panacea domain-containing protein [Candidatus Sungbacteria bacterium]|nr:Panacea domain-containing protein [bacterium]MDZ4286275.1 Panacea domain-containing protein [Candidatus Sungbacteria bacterium]